MNKHFLRIICLALLLITFLNFNTISDFILKKISVENKLIVPKSNNYVKEYDFNFVQRSNTYIPYSKQDLLNIIYTVLNNGWKEFAFYCPSEYEECVNDITSISDDETILTDLNNFVSPYNSFTNIKTTISDSGEIVLNVNYLYSDEYISLINQKVQEVIKNLDSNKSDYDKIKWIHDYIINNARYDVKRNKEGSSDYLSYIAYGPLYEGYATCNGYTDLMAIFLDNMGYKNFKISTSLFELNDDETGHIWNAVYIDNKWVHLDLTWDDPVGDDDKDYLYHTYFLISTDELVAADSGQVKTNDHKFNKSIYTELKN